MTRRIIGAAIALLGGTAMAETPLYAMPGGAETRWASGENPTAAKGAGGKANNGAKGAAFYAIRPGETAVLLDAQGPGVVNRMWCTLNDRSPEMLRALRIDMHWDGAATPAVSAPFGDFFGMVHGETSAFENEFFSSPEGRSFNFSIPMPFRTGARITVTNESDRTIDKFFYDINYTALDTPDPKALYFHAHWRRERWTELRKDFAILSRIEGKGRFLGLHLGVLEHPKNSGWWGEGEVKIYLDGDGEFATLVGTGTEDYVGTGWEQGTYTHRSQGCWMTDKDRRAHSLYRYHTADPVWFHTDIRVDIQQIGGDQKDDALAAIANGAEVIPISVNYDTDEGNVFVPLLEAEKPVELSSVESPPRAWTNMYRRDDVCAVAFFYLDRPENALPPLAPTAERTAHLPAPKG